MGLSRKNWLRRLHLWLGLAVSIPVLAWSVSGFLLAIPPGVVEGEPYVVVDARRVNRGETAQAYHTKIWKYPSLQRPI